MRVELIVTGSMERRTLHRSLSRWFPETRAGDPVEFATIPMFNGPTSNPLPEDLAQLPSEPIQVFSNLLVATTIFGQGRALPDLVIGIEDLELANAGRAPLVTQWIRRGVETWLERNPENARADERRRERLRTRCSFHLLVPMPEAYFFGERAALERAGVASGVEPIVSSRDLEAFETDDPAFTPRPDRPDDRKHPKRYLKHLLHQSEPGRLYKETRDGARALETLAWPELTDDPSTLQFARALFEDIADALGVPNPLGEGVLAPATHPPDRRDLVLRNL